MAAWLYSNYILLHNMYVYFNELYALICSERKKERGEDWRSDDDDNEERETDDIV